MPYTRLSDPLFDRPIQLRDAYRIMERFVEDYVARGDVPVFDFMLYLGIVVTGESSDPAALDDFLQAAASVLAKTDAA